MRYFFFVASFIFSSLCTIAQSKLSKLSKEEWLKMISVEAPLSQQNHFSHHPGFALYFSQAGDIKVPYLVYTPKSYDPKSPQPAVVFLHGAILARDSFQYDSPEIANEPVFSVADTLHTIVIFPFARQDFKWAGASPAFDNIITIIRQVEEHYNVDKKRIYLGGISMGGNATFWFINNKPELFAGFYTFSALPGNTVQFSNITKEKPLYSINAKDDLVFSYTEVKATFMKHKVEAPGWHFTSVENGGHRFIYSKGGAIYIQTVLSSLLNPKQQ